LKRNSGTLHVSTHYCIGTKACPKIIRPWPLFHFFNNIKNIESLNLGLIHLAGLRFLEKEILLRKMNSIFWKVVSVLLAMTIYTVIMTIYNPVLALTIQTELRKAELYFFSVSNSITLFRLDVGRYPSTHEGLLVLFKRPNDINSEVWLGPYLKPAGLKDIWGQNYEYTYPGIHNKDFFDLLSLGRDGIEGTVDDINNWDENSSWKKYYRKNKPWKEYWYEYYHVIISLGFGLLVGILLEVIRVTKLKKRKNRQ